MNGWTELPDDDEEDTIVPTPGGREHHPIPTPRTRIRLEIIRELRQRDFTWKEIAYRMGYASIDAIDRMLHRLGVKIR